MNQVEVYQSVLTNIGRLSSNQMVELASFLNQLIENPALSFSKEKGISELAGAWESWSEADFDDFLTHTSKSRAEMLNDGNVEL